MAYTFRNLFAFCILFSSSIYTNKSSVAATNTCGSLITYRQYSTTLKSAPQCFIDGCTTNNTAPSSMSYTCQQGEACSELWNLISGEYKQPWCANCTNDIACRIPGWPILNASALCDITPNTWLFGNQGSCCTAGNQSYQLARWVGTMCNGSEWRESFDYYGGMAMLDWEEWLLPWNWTVRPENTTAVKLPKCPGRPLALLGFAAENFIFLLFAILATAGKLSYIHSRELWYLQGQEGKKPWATKIRDFFHPLAPLKFWRLRKFKALGNSLKRLKFWKSNEEDRSNKTPNEVIFGILWSMFMLGLQIGLNFVSAALVKRTPGYGHVPLGRLALLFCCRPRLSWVATLLEHTSDETLENWFKVTEEKYVNKAKLTLHAIGIGAAISELVLQGISSYFMVLTTNVGRSRGFYYIHHLRPYWNGPTAQAMYLGALFWTITFFFVFFAWFLVLRYGYLPWALSTKRPIENLNILN